MAAILALVLFGLSLLISTGPNAALQFACEGSNLMVTFPSRRQPVKLTEAVEGRYGGFEKARLLRISLIMAAAVGLSLYVVSAGCAVVCIARGAGAYRAYGVVLMALHIGVLVYGFAAIHEPMSVLNDGPLSSP